MSFHKVEVDDEVFEYVKGRAEPLIDTFNSVLKRLLLVVPQKPVKPRQDEIASPRADGLLPNLPRHLPQALQHILEVASLVRDGAYDRPRATQFVAREHDVFPQTVLDKYCRQLNLKAREFDRLLEQPDLTELKRILTLKFPGYRDTIEEILT